MDPLEVRRTRPAKSNVSEPIRETASQTAGPYVHIGCVPSLCGVDGVYTEDLISNNAVAYDDPITISGSIFDGDGVPCKDALLEFWQADQAGNFENGIWHRAATDLDTGTFTFQTVIPGAMTVSENEYLAPFINVWIVARGINVGLSTRIYFPEFSSENEKDRHLAMVSEERRPTLIARVGEEKNSYHFNIYIQGEQETVFFET